jgi:hypothetical protein
MIRRLLENRKDIKFMERLLLEYTSILSALTLPSLAFVVADVVYR